MKSIQVKVNSETGLHARPASQLVSTASSFESEITISKDDVTASAKSIFGVLGLGVATGDSIEITFEGSDEDEALSSIQKLFDEGL